MVFLSSHYPDQLWGIPSLLSNGYWAILNLYHPCVAAYMWSMWPYISQYHTATPLGPAGNSIVKGFKFLIPIWDRLTIGCFILNQRSNRIIICFAVLYWDHIFVCTCALPSCHQSVALKWVQMCQGWVDVWNRCMSASCYCPVIFS